MFGPLLQNSTIKNPEIETFVWISISNVDTFKFKDQYLISQ